ncbi:hypothetical protein TWF225_001462 [Orbilia oligospora]|uniref:Uncharacterized protein n=1 Tax=Orbilia oligospora TaxID=2813651 RepID=A0A7C8PV11_ORBOL|nr:hypothetical protein TWF751_010913 [Orbilia oligospora]KAF3191320.1 hypothetical protein TWF225_001462 [Orbilia oligospora]KAF3267786.1 hypothetical protein TWF217_011522 [Orbilia oligospora]KAF3269498.1 hypothetical protein TWF128_005718 [Orbilia oligospora]TGJ66175.1 hypothetical protein EYR41_007826 [Orbilia oligospora]
MSELEIAPKPKPAGDQRPSMPRLSDEERAELTKKFLASIRVPQRPPPNFDPLRATAAELKTYGLPPRPKNTKRLAEWEQQMSKQKSATFISNPTFKPRQRRQGSIKKTANPFKNKSGPYKKAKPLIGQIKDTDDADEVDEWDTVDWSGAVISNSDYFWTIKAKWTVPTPDPGRSDEDAWCVSAWVGIDGWAGDDGFSETTWFSDDLPILAGGTSHEVYEDDDDGSIDRYIYAWYRWYPSDEIEIDLTVNSGDVVYCHIWATDTSTGHFYIHNESTDEYASFEFAAPDGYSLQGDSAEWIVQDYWENSLARFGSIEFTDCSAGEASSLPGDDPKLEDDTVWVDLNAANNIGTMEEGDGASCTLEIDGDSDLKVIRDDDGDD